MLTTETIDRVIYGICRSKINRIVFFGKVIKKIKGRRFGTQYRLKLIGLISSVYLNSPDGAMHHVSY